MEVMESATVSEEEKEEIRLSLIGKTGSGKSETGNTILGKKMFETSPLQRSKTKACTVKRNLRNGTMIEVLDTVGFLDTDKTMIETLTEVVTAVVSMHPGPHAILYIIKIERFTAEVMDSYNVFKRSFDDAISKYIIIVLTHGDDLEREGLTLDDAMKDAPEAFRRLCAEVKNRVVIFNNIDENKDHQVNNLLQVVREMMSENQNIPYSSSKYAYAGYLVDQVIDLGVMISTATATVNNIPNSLKQMYDRVKTSNDIISGSHHNEENREAEVRPQEIDERERTLREKEELLKRQQKVNEQERLLIKQQKLRLKNEEDVLKRLMEEKERTLKEREDKIISRVREEEKKRKEREEKQAKGENRRDYRRRFIDGSEEEDSIFDWLVNIIVKYIYFWRKLFL